MSRNRAVVYVDENSMTFPRRERMKKLLREASRDTDSLNDVIYLGITKNPREANIMITASKNHDVRNFAGAVVIFGDDPIREDMNEKDLRKLLAWKLGQETYRCSLGGGEVSCDPATW